MPRKFTVHTIDALGYLLARGCGGCVDWKAEQPGGFIGFCSRYSWVRVADQSCEKWKKREPVR